ncbi:hypothetical protein PJI17_09760 [Mycobacterium kansasii]
MIDHTGAAPPATGLSRFRRPGAGGSDGAAPTWSQAHGVPLETTAYDWQEHGKPR